MPDSKSQASALLRAHADSITELHSKLAAIPGVDKERLSQAVAKYKVAVSVFEDDAQGTVVMPAGG